MAQYIITLSAEEEKALLTDMISIQEWIENAIKNKARQCIDRVVDHTSRYQARKLSLTEKLKIVRETKVESAAKRQARLEAEMRKKPLDVR